MQTSQTKPRFPSVYNPATQSPEEIVSNFVVRLDEFNELFQAVKADKMENPPQHYMIQGQRGYGKTTLLLRVKIEIAGDEQLQEWLIPVMFSEEQYAVRTLAGLWEETASILSDQDESFSGLPEEVEALYTRDNPEEEIYNLLIEALHRRKKKLVLLLDNFGDMIAKFSRKENQRLREVLITSNEIRLIGASSTVLEFYHSYKEPFFDFFKVVSLDELNREQVIALLAKLGETYGAEAIQRIIAEQPERIDSLRRLTGGVPRTIVLLFEIFVDEVDGNSFKDLEMILDRVTPLYKHRLDNLSTQQQAIIDAIAQNWDAISTKEIAKAVRMPSKAVSSQLNQLEKNQIIRKIPTSTKNHLYQITERFFNIYYLMRLGRKKNKNRVLWLVRFFEICCGPRELVERAQRHIAAMQGGRLDEKHAFYVSQALAKTRLPYEIQHEMLEQTKKYLTEKRSPFAKDLLQSHVDVMNAAAECIQKKDTRAARRKLEQDGVSPAEASHFIAERLKDDGDYGGAADFYVEAVKSGDVPSIYALAKLSETELNDLAQAEFYYKKAAALGNPQAMDQLGRLYEQKLNDTSSAEKYYLMAADKGNDWAMLHLGSLYKTKARDYTKAELYYEMAVEKGNDWAMDYLGQLYESELGDLKRAEKHYLIAVEKGNDWAMLHLASLYASKHGDYEKAEPYYKMAVEKGNDWAMLDLGLHYEVRQDYPQAERYYKMAAEKGNDWAMLRLADLYRIEFKDMDSAERYSLMAADKGNDRAMSNLGLLYQTEFKDIVKAEKYYSMAAEKGNSEAASNLACLYFFLKKNKKEALDLQKKAYESRKDTNFALGYIIVLLWNEEVEEAVKVYRESVDSEEHQKDVNPDINYILMAFIAKKQYNFVHRLFKENKYDLRDKYRPVYYALLSLMGEAYADELKRMGGELKESVQDVLKAVGDAEARFGPPETASQ